VGWIAFMGMITHPRRTTSYRQDLLLRKNMKTKKQEVRLPQRSDVVSGKETKVSTPIAAAQKENRTMQPATPDKKSKRDR
jgi:hypothetical protein